ncbi:unnamed protein product, partial [Mesorhabditis spiculigera]
MRRILILLSLLIFYLSLVQAYDQERLYRLSKRSFAKVILLPFHQQVDPAYAPSPRLLNLLSKSQWRYGML